MKTLNKLILTFLLMFAVNISAQGVFYLHGVSIPQKYQANFESNEKEYFSKLAQDYVNSGKMQGWAVLKRVPRIGHAQDYKFNYFWVHGFESIDQMVSAQADPFWNKFESKFKKKPSELLKESQSERSGTYYFKTYDQFSTGQGKYVILNDGKVKDIQMALDMGKQTGKIFKKNSKKSGMKGWGVATVIAPQDKHNKSNVFYWDIYDTLANAMKHMAGEAAILDIPDEMAGKFYENLPDGFSHRNITEIIIGTTPKE